MGKIKVRKSTLSIFLCLCIAALGVAIWFSIGSPSHASASMSEETDYTDLTFILNSDETGYKVKTNNRKITHVDIPDTYNGLPVTEVADNGFALCYELVYAHVPATVTRLGNNAFSGDKELVRVKGMVNVTEIGNAAFAQCVKLKNLIIPASAQTMGRYVIRSVVNPVYVRTEGAVAYADAPEWAAGSTAEIIYGNDLVCSEEYDEDGELCGYSLESEQAFFFDSDDNEIILSHNGLPIIKIDEFAFVWCQAKTLTFKADETLAEQPPVLLSAFAFDLCEIEKINFEVDVSITEDSWGLFELNASLTEVRLPATFDVIPMSAFAACYNLSKIYIGNNEANHLDGITYIGECAFDSCMSIAQLTVAESVEMIESAAFDGWGQGSPQTINFERTCPDPLWSDDWAGSALTNENCEMIFLPMTAYLDAQKGTDAIKEITVWYHQSMPGDIVEPKCEGYKFEGYYDQPGGDGTKYYDADMISTHIWDKPEGTTLYANWTFKEYNITYDTSGWNGEEFDFTPTVSTYTMEVEVVFGTFNVGDVTLGWFPSVIPINSTGDVTVYITATVTLTTDDTAYYADICDRVVLILPSTAPSELSIAADGSVKALGIIGTEDVEYKMDITAYSQADKFTVVLENVNMQAPDGRTAITAKNCDSLIVMGTTDVKIVGGTGIKGDGVNAIYCNDLYLSVPRSCEMTIQGGKGAKGETFKVGYNGGAAIYARRGQITCFTGSFQIIGGTGGQGGNSKNPIGVMGGAGGNPFDCAESYQSSGIKLYTIDNATVTYKVGAHGPKGIYDFTIPDHIVVPDPGAIIIPPQPPIVKY